MEQLLKKYTGAAPRYTSYPSVPDWKTPPGPLHWERKVQALLKKTNGDEGISLYVHLPFCESLCTYCGCNTRITVNHGVELPYITAVLSEWEMYLSLMSEPPRIKELHLGGGTPTFFSPAHLTQLVRGLLSASEVCPDAILSFEGHPDNTSTEHLQALYDLGFTRISLGIQDFDPQVQKAIHRFQTVAQVKSITKKARDIGYTSVNYDLIYGLPLQTSESMSRTLDTVASLKPDRIAFYGYAHVPWVKPGQRSFTEADLPDPATRRQLYEMGLQRLGDDGYVEIGLDHFALPEDELCVAAENGLLHRNFMGYTPFRTELLIGLGVSSISDADGTFVQNEKKLDDYYSRILRGEFPFFKGHVPCREDGIIRNHILSLMCRMKTDWEREADRPQELERIINELQPMASDGLVVMSGHGLIVTELGKPFLRLICKVFDHSSAETDRPVFSQAV